MMTSMNSLNQRVHKVEQNIETILLENKATINRVKVVEYKSIDLEARSRRNNLIFRGHPEVYLDENCEHIVADFIEEYLGLDPSSMYVQELTE
jgi:hypothetical protein